MDGNKFFFSTNGSPMIQPDNLSMMMVGMMANTIAWTEDEKDRSYQIMNEEITDWAEHGYTNAKLTQAQFIYDFFEEFLKHDTHKFMGIIFTSRGHFTLFIRMTEAVQAWRDRVRDEERKKYGPNWGSALKFMTFDWTALNHKIRERYLQQ